MRVFHKVDEVIWASKDEKRNVFDSQWDQISFPVVASVTTQIYLNNPFFDKQFCQMPKKNRNLLTYKYSN